MSLWQRLFWHADAATRLERELAADETSAADGTVCRRCGGTLDLVGIAGKGLVWRHADSSVGHDPVLVAEWTEETAASGFLASRADLGTVNQPSSRPTAPPSEVLRDHIALLESELAERTWELEDECRINAVLRGRVKGLELTVVALGAEKAGA